METARKPYVSVTLEGPDDGGDYGRNTPGTRSGGIQEALNYAHGNNRDIYIHGGGFGGGDDPQANVYTLDETLEVPWNQDFRLDGGNYLLHYTRGTGDAVVIDSQMNCRYKFGLIVATESNGAAVRIRPHTLGPDNFVVVTASIFDFSALCSPGGGGVARGAGLVLDSSDGPIINSRFFAEETNTHVMGVYLTDAGGSGSLIANNSIEVMYNNQYHVTEGPSTGLRVGDPGSSKIIHNRFDMSLHGPRGSVYDEETQQFLIPEGYVAPDDAVGADIFAQRNQFTLTCYGRRPEGNDIVFEADAEENTVFALNLPNGVTNRADVPTNRVVTNWPVGFDVPTPPVPLSGSGVVNTTPYTVQIMILSGGEVSDWTIMDSGRVVQELPSTLSLADSRKWMGTESGRPPRTSPSSQTFSAGLAAGQAIVLEPGMRIAFTYSQAPEWRWLALR